MQEVKEVQSERRVGGVLDDMERKKEHHEDGGDLVSR